MSEAPLLFYPKNHFWITLTGPDAEDFLHRLSSVNTRALEPGRGSPGCFLTAQGKLRAFFRLWRTGEHDFAFEVDAGEGGRWKSALLATIDQYTFAEKMTLQETSLKPVWIFPTENATANITLSAGANIMTTSEGIHICQHGGKDYGRPWISAWGEETALKNWITRNYPYASQTEEPMLELWRIENTRPRLDVELTEETNPLEVGLVDAIAQQKGCYPGQEVIEKILALGAPARRLVQIQGEGTAPLVKSSVLNQAEPPATLGEITSATALPQGQFLALALLKKIHAKEGAEVTIGAQRAQVKAVAPYA